MAADPSIIKSIRDASRRLVRELGFMQRFLADTSLPPSAVHALVEVDARGRLQAIELVDLLRLDKSSVSRMVRKLVDAGLVAESAQATDGRAKALSLTISGRAVTAGIHEFARKQVAAALDGMPPPATGRRGRGPSALCRRARRREGRAGADAGGDRDRLCSRPVRPLHRECRVFGFYALRHRFGRAFEARIAAGLGEFAGRIDRPVNAIWHAARAGRIIGTITVDGEDLGVGIAHLRWFIVDDGLRGAGIGRRLLAAAIAHCDRHQFRETHLWTFRGLDAARRLYEANGFELAEARPGATWGREVMEQHFVRLRGAHVPC